MAETNGAKTGLKGKAVPAISISAILGVVVQGFLGYQENKTKAAQADFTYQVVREMKASVDETLEKVNALTEREARLEGVVEGLKDALAVVQNRRIHARDRHEAIEKILEGLGDTGEAAPDKPEPEPEPASDEATGSLGMGGGGAGPTTGFEAASATILTGARPKARLPDKLPQSVEAVQQAQQQLQEVFK